MPLLQIFGNFILPTSAIIFNLGTLVLSITKTVEVWNHVSTKLRACGAVMIVFVCQLLLSYHLHIPKSRTEFIIDLIGIYLCPLPYVRSPPWNHAPIPLQPLPKATLQPQSTFRIGPSRSRAPSCSRRHRVRDQGQAPPLRFEAG